MPQPQPPQPQWPLWILGTTLLLLLGLAYLYWVNPEWLGLLGILGAVSIDAVLQVGGSPP